MTYLQALRTLVKAYKAARGVMPKGLDLLKMKMKARQKVIDANKVIQAADRFDKGNWFRLNKRPAREGFGRPKGLARYEGGGEGIKKLIDKGLIRIGEVTKRKKVKEPVDPKLYQQERIKEIMKQNKEAAKRLEKKMQNQESYNKLIDPKSDTGIKLSRIRERLKNKKDLGDKLKDYKGDPDAI